MDLGDRLTGSNAMISQPRLLTVNIVHRIHPGYFHDTAIDKQPVDGPMELNGCEIRPLSVTGADRRSVRK